MNAQTPDQNNASKHAPKVPSAVEAAARRAEEIMAQMKAAEQPQPDPNPDENDEAPGEVQEPVQPQGEPPPKLESQIAEPPIESSDSKPKRVTVEEWERRFNAMKGRYDAELARTNQLTQDIISIRKQMAGLEARVNPRVDSTQTIVPQITAEEEEAYGKDLLEVVAKRAMQAVQPKLDALLAENERLKTRLDGVGNFVAASAEEQMHQLLDGRVPSWRQMNVDPDFIQWLSYSDSYSGAQRQELLNDAYARQDGQRVVAFFEGYLKEAQATAPQNGQAQPSAGAAHSAPAKQPLAKFAAPGKGKSAAPTGPVQGKPIYTQADLSRFWANVAAGRYRGHEAEKARIEEDIFRAQAEGRIYR